MIQPEYPIRLMDPQAFHLSHDQVDIAASVLPPPILSYDTLRKVWRLEATYRYHADGHDILVPDGFEFDLSSVPRIFWRLVAPFELSIAAPLLHDFLYRHRGDPPPGAVVPPRTYSRKEVDDLFKRIMKQEGVPGWRWRLAYAAVRVFGQREWDD